MTTPAPVFKAKLTDFKAKFTELSRRSDRSGLIQLSRHVGIALGTGWLVVNLAQTYWLPLAIVLHGVVLVSPSRCGTHPERLRDVFVPVRSRAVPSCVRLAPAGLPMAALGL